MIKTIWLWIKRGSLIAGVLLSFFALMECLRAYQTLKAFHPWVGYAFMILLAGGLIALIIWCSYQIMTRPRVLTPPAFADPDQPAPNELRRYGRYLTRYLQRLAGNPNLIESTRQRARLSANTLYETLAGSGDLKTAIEEAENLTIEPLLAELDDQAEKEVRRCVRDVMIGVTFSPYQALDLLIVIYRNLTMVTRVIRIYHSRPRASEQWKIFNDIVGVIATVNYIDMGRDLLEHLGTHVPGIGKFVDDIAQGTGAGFMTSIVGHAAIHRCRAFKRWNQAEARETVYRNLKGFYSDVKDLFKKDILPGIMGRVAGASRDTWEKIMTALDETGNTIGNFVMGTVFRRKNGAGPTDL